MGGAIRAVVQEQQDTKPASPKIFLPVERTQAMFDAFGFIEDRNSDHRSQGLVRHSLIGK